MMTPYNQTVDRAEVEQDLRQFFAANPPGIVAVYLFGSVARDTAGPHSDIDVGVLYAATPPSTLAGGPLDLESALERRLRKPVQLVVLNRAPVDLRARVLRDGRLIADLDRSARIRFEVRTRNEAFDLEPVLRQYRAATTRRR